MAVGTLSVKRTKTEKDMPDVPTSVPVSVISDWVEICDAPETADNSGSTVVNPGAITRSAQNKLYNHGVGTSLQIRLKYDTGAGTLTSPVIQAFGFDGNGLPQRLKDKDGNHELTLTLDGTNDVRDSSFKYSAIAEVDMDGCASVLVAVKTAFAASSGTVNNSTIQVRVK